MSALSRFFIVVIAFAWCCSSAIAGIVVSGGGLTLEGEGGTFAANNLAASGISFAKDVLAGYASHTISHLNDATYGNANSWIAGSANSFAGVNLGANPVAVNRIAFGRDNLGVQTGDRVLDTYTLQYTTVANPDASTPDASWITIGTLDYQSAGGTNFASPALRHVFSFNSVNATGLRLKTVADGTCIDEIEIYNVNAPNIALQVPAGTDVDEGGTVDIGSATIGATSAPKTFTIVNTGTQNLTGLSITKNGANASEFTVSALSTAALAPAGTRTFTVSFKPTKAGTRTAALHIASNVQGTKNPFDIQLTGTPVCPTITVNKPATTTGLTSAAFSQTFTQTGGVAPIVYSTTDTLPAGITLSAAGKLSGKTTQVGTFNITVSAIDSRGCTGTASVYTLTITRGPGPQLVVEQPVSNVVPSAGTVAFGNQVYGTSTARTFTLKNTGTSVLNVGSMTKDGPNADRFTVSALSGTSSIAVGDSRTFSVTYQPTAFGSNTAALHIPSNDLVTPITHIHLTGTSVCPTITVTNPTVVNANTVEPFSQAFTQTGSIGTTSFTTTSTLPAGLTLSSTGVLAGTPTEDGTFAITVTATGDLGCSGTGEAYTLTVVRPPLLIISVEETVGVPLPNNSAEQGSILTGSTTSAKTYTITNTGTESITLNAFTKSGANPGDFTVSAASGNTISAGGTATFTTTFTPNRGGPRSALLRISGSDGTLSSPVDLLLSGTGLVPTITITNPTITTATTGVAFSQVFTQTGGLGATTFSIASGIPPTGVSLAEDGTLAGTPTRTGRFPITVRATDAYQTSVVSTVYTLVVAHGTGPQLTVEQPAGTDVAGSATFLHMTDDDEGDNGRSLVPPGLGAVSALSMSQEYALALKTDGTLVAWGNNSSNELNVPGDLANVREIAAGGGFGLALRSDDTMIAWGGLFDFGIPATEPNVISIAAGIYSAAAVKTDGTVVVWGFTGQSALNVPPGLSGVTRVAVGGGHVLALKSDGTVVAWGVNSAGQATVPSGLSNVVAIAAGFTHSLALKSDGTVVAWGSNGDGEATVPIGLFGVKTIFAAPSASYALKHDGTLVAWGDTPLQQSFAHVKTLAAGRQTALLHLSAVPMGEGKIGEPNAPMTLTLHNTGDAPLTLGAITKDGAHPDDFIVSAPANTALAPGQSTGLAVSLLPTRLGSRYCTLRIASNDSAASPTEVLLTGKGIPAVVTVQKPVIATGTVGQAFSQRFTQTGCVGRVTWGQINSSLFVAGLDVNSDTGEIFGVPTREGTFSLSAYVEDDAQNHGESTTYTLVINKAPQGRFAVTSPGGIGLESGDAVDLGASQVSVASKPRIFTVTNVGNAPASVGLVTITGANSSDFTLFTLPSSATLAPAASATFSVVFKPAAVGTRTALLELPGLSFPISATGSATPVTDPVPPSTAPNLAVEQPVNFPHTHTSTQALGTLGLNVPKALTYTVRNSGTQPLTGLSVSLSGQDAAQFSIVSQPASSIAGGSSGTFTVQAKLTSLGSKTARLRILSNAPNESPFDLTLAATCAAAITPVVTTAPGGKVSHPNGIGRGVLAGTVNTRGTLCYVAFDYGLTKAYGITTPPKPVTNNASADFSEIVSGLLPHKTYHFRIRAIGDQGSAFGKDLTFTVPNQAPEAQVDEPYFAVGTPLTIDALLNDRDNDGDPLTIISKTAVSPSTAGTVAIVKNKLVFTPSSSFTTGSASFDYTIKDSFGSTDTATVRLIPLPITLTPPSITRQAAGGSYDITITAFATQVTENLPWLSAVKTSSGVNTSTVQITLLPNTSINPRSGRIIIDGQTHDVVQLGVTKPAITPMSSTPHEAIVSGFFSLAIPLVDGPATFTATDLPPGLTIDNVTNLISGTPTTAGTYNVVLRAKNAAGPLATDSAGIAAATATCTIHVSALDSNLIGTYHGLISPSQVAYLTPNLNIGARLELTTTGVGAVTGQIIEGSTKVSLKGQLAATVADPDHPVAILTLIGPKTRLPMTLNVTLDKASNTLAGHLYRLDTFPARTPVEAWRSTWTATNPATEYAALHTLAIENVSTTQPSPDGFGFGSFTPGLNTGLLTLKGTLADGSSLVCSTFIGPAGQVLCYQALYANRGSCVGKLTVTPGTPAPTNNTLLGQFTWLKPAPLATSKDLIYRAGFGPLSLDVAGSAYPAPAAGERVLGLPAATAPATNAKLAFTLGGLDTSLPASLEFEQPLTITNPSATGFTNVASIPAPINSTTLPTLTAATGAFAGSFTIPGTTAALNRKATFNGQIVKVSGVTTGYGHFLLPTITPVVTTSPRLSGRVELKP